MSTDKYIFRMFYSIGMGKTYNCRVIASSLEEASDKVQRALNLQRLSQLGCSGFVEVGAEND